MKKSLIFLLISAGAISVSAANLLKNGGFEDGITGWLKAERLVKTEFSFDTVNKKEKNQSLRFSVVSKVREKDSKQAFMISSERVPVIPGMELNYSYYFACKDVVQGQKSWSIARVTINFYSVDGKRVSWGDILSVKGTQEWKRYSGKKIIPRNAAFADIRFGFSDSTGTVWIDDVQLFCEGKAQASAQQLLLNIPSTPVLIPTPKKMISAGNGIKEFQGNPVQGDLKNKVIAKKWKKYFPKMKFSSLGDQGYFLAIDSDGVFIGANTPAGFRYAAQSLKMLKHGGGYLQYAIADWPSIPRRGVVCGLQWSRWDNYSEMMRRAEKYKMNFIWHTGSFMDHKFSRQWRVPLTEADFASLKKRNDMASRYGLELYLTASPRGIPPVEYSSAKEIKMIADKLTAVYHKTGIRNLGIAFDDLCNIDQAKLIHDSDKAKFPGGIGEAHCYFVTEIYKKVKKNCPEVNFLVLPMFYQSYASASPDEIKYTKQFAKLPEEIREWCNCLYTEEDIKENKKLTGRKPFIWDNGYTQGRIPLFPYAVKRPQSTPDMISGYMFLLAWPKLEDALQITWNICADYMWASDSYVPETSRKRAVAYAVRDPKIREIVEEYAKLSKKVLDMDFARNTKAARLADFRNTIAALKKSLTNMNVLPKQLQDVLKSEITGYLKSLEFQTSALETQNYPNYISAKEPEKPQALKFNPFRCDKTENTTVALWHDKTNLYVKYTCFEPQMKTLKAKYTNQDSNVFLDDSVEMFILPESVAEADQVYYHIALNSRGCIADTKHIRRKFNHINDLYQEWSAAANVTSWKTNHSWNVLVTVPLKNVGLTGKNGERFFLNLTRTRHAGGKKEYSTFAFIPSDRNFHMLSAYPMFEFSGTEKK